MSDASALTTRAGRAFFAFAAATALAVGALQMFRVHGGWLTNYGADFFGTAWLFAMTRLGRTIVQRGRVLAPIPSAAVVFALCTVSEFGQRWHLVPGHFDPYDIATFAIAVVACVAAEMSTAPFAVER